jgi:hypothetical protein
MLIGLIRSTSSDRVHEEQGVYETEPRRLTKQKQERDKD